MANKKIATQIRLDESLYELVKNIADEEMRSLNAQMEYFIKSGAKKYVEENTPGCECFSDPDKD